MTGQLHNHPLPEFAARMLEDIRALGRWTQANTTTIVVHPADFDTAMVTAQRYPLTEVVADAFGMVQRGTAIIIKPSEISPELAPPFPFSPTAPEVDLGNGHTPPSHG